MGVGRLIALVNKLSRGRAIDSTQRITNFYKNGFCDPNLSRLAQLRHEGFCSRMMAVAWVELRLQENGVQKKTLGVHSEVTLLRLGVP